MHWLQSSNKGKKNLDIDLALNSDYDKVSQHQPCKVQLERLSGV